MVDSFDACLLDHVQSVKDRQMRARRATFFVFFGVRGDASPLLTEADAPFATPGGSRRTATPPYPDLDVLREAYA